MSNIQEEEQSFSKNNTSSHNNIEGDTIFDIGENTVLLIDDIANQNKTNKYHEITFQNNF